MNALLPAACLIGLVASACFAASRDPNQEYANFQTAAAQAPREGYTPYWLGREFDAGSYTFSGPSVADFGDVTNGSLTLTYNAQDANGGFGLTIVLFSRTAWAAAQSAGLGRIPRNARTENVTVAGHPATLVVIPAGAGDAHALQLQLETGDTVIRAGIAVTVPPGGGPDPNPLSDEQTFLNVLQNLRPYPQ